MIWFSIDIVVWFYMESGDWNDLRMSMLLRKELESLELTHPNESSTLTNTSETATTFGLSKVFKRQKKQTMHFILKPFEWFCVDPFSFKFSKRNLPSPSEEVALRSHDEKKEKLFLRPGIIDEEPDSMDSIISNPSSFPITVLPPTTAGGAGVLIRNSTQSSFGRLSRISTNSKYVFFCVYNWRMIITKMWYN